MLEDVAKAYKEIVRATKEFVHSAGFEDVVIGLSGGIDSSLVATIAVDALGPSHVHGIMMPGPYSSESSLTDARQLADNLGISTAKVSIEEPYAAFAHVLSPALGGALTGVTSENIQARCRMICIMAMSNSKDWMMLNTGNKSEAAMGYSTLYGDTAGAFAPIGGIYKTDVYALSRWRNAQAKSSGDIEPIPANVLVKSPSAELAPNQIDEASMGVDYKTLDEILTAFIDEGRSEDEIVARGFNRTQVMMILNRYRAYEYKRAQEPEYPSV